jgi:phage tail tube protein FII
MDRIIYGGNAYLNTINMRLSLAKFKLPDLKRAKESLVMGGGFFKLSIPYEIEELESTFSLNGGHEYVRTQFGKEPGDWSTLFYYERIRNIRLEASKRDYGRVVMMKGLLDEVQQPEVEGKKAQATQYKWATIVDYRDILDGHVIHQMTPETNTLIIDGVNYSETHNQIIAA